MCWPSSTLPSGLLGKWDAAAAETGEGKEEEEALMLLLSYGQQLLREIERQHDEEQEWMMDGHDEQSEGDEYNESGEDSDESEEAKTEEATI